jgi:hypothetical protein
MTAENVGRLLAFVGVMFVRVPHSWNFGLMLPK